MSSMLEQAIVDAEELKQAAVKNAEEVVIEKYQDEIREAVEVILEQDEEPADIPGAEEDFIAPVETDMMMEEEDESEPTFVDDLPTAQRADMEEMVTIDLDKLEEMMAEEIEEGGLEAAEMGSREQIADDIDALVNENDDESVELDEEMLASVLSELELDEDVLNSLLEDSEESESESLEEEKEEEELEEEKKPLAAEADPKDKVTPEDFKNLKKGARYNESLKNENKKLVKMQTTINKKVSLLEKKLNKYTQVIFELKNKLDESTLASAKLLYQNRVLNGVSLNERQKNKIVETISNASSVEEAKIVFETLQSAVGSLSKNKRPESLNEVVTRSSSAFLPRKEEKQKVDPFTERMRILAGLKNN